MRVFKSKRFARFARREGIGDARLCKAVEDVDAGRIDADYGGGVIKQRIARPNEGKSGGYRTIILYRLGERAFFVYGFSKSERDNIDVSDVLDFKELAKVLLAASNDQLNLLASTGKFLEVKCDGEDIQE